MDKKQNLLHLVLTIIESVPRQVVKSQQKETRGQLALNSHPQDE